VRRRIRSSSEVKYRKLLYQIIAFRANLSKGCSGLPASNRVDLLDLIIMEIKINWLPNY
jgi:hypothetical protein